ncbi:MAG: outer membrane beta-barrel protein [Chlamydiota bacterium]|nr:outer membrane beta-barrel protein [Chlamydiota bacterium]
MQRLITLVFIAVMILPLETFAASNIITDIQKEPVIKKESAIEKETDLQPIDEPLPSKRGEKDTGFHLKAFYDEHFSVLLQILEQWDSNILLDPADEKDDFITIVSPDITLNYSGDTFYAESEYIGRYAYYLDSDQFIYNHSLSGLAYYTPTRNLAIGTRLNLDFTDQGLVNTVFGDRILQYGYTILSAAPGVKYRFTPDLLIDLAYEFDTINIEDKDNDDEVDRTGNGFSAKLEYEYNPQLFMFARYRLKDMNFREMDTKDSLSHLYSVGLRKKMANLFNLDLELTFHDKDFDVTPDDDRLEGSGTLTTTFSRFTTLVFSAGYMLQYSSRLEFSQYASTYTSVVLQHYLTSKTIISFRGSYERQFFPEEDMLDDFLLGDIRIDLYDASINLRQIINSWLSVELSYRYQERDTEFESEDFQDHIVQWGVRAYF